MTKMNRWTTWTLTAITATVLLLGAGAMVVDTAPSPDELASKEAQEWIDDLGPVVSSELVYSEDFGHPVWRVRGTSTTVIMDNEYDLVGLEFH